MKRPILIAVIGYIIGIIWGLYLKINIIPIIFILLISIPITYKINKQKIKPYKNIIILIAITAIISNIQITYLNKKYNTMYIKNQEYKVIATVVSNTQEKEYKNTYKIKIESINGNKKYANTHLLLNVKKNKAKLQYGDKISFNGTYIEPTTRRNYKGFDYKEYLKTIKIYGSFTPETEIKIIKKDNVNIISKAIFNIKEKITSNVNKSLEEETKNLCLGILLGDTQNINDDLKEDFKIGNLYHILAVSGTHISYLIIGATFILEKSKINKKISKILTILILIFFMILTGLSPSVVRAGIMGIILISASLFYRKLDILTSISLSLLISLINNPFSINNNGLLLSYGGTIGIVLFEKKIEKLCLTINIYKTVEKRRGITLKGNTRKTRHCALYSKLKNLIISMLSVTISAQIIILPIMMLKFNTISFTFFISNILAGFLIGIIIIFGYMLIMLSLISINLAKYGFLFYNFILKTFIFIVKICSKLPFSKVYITTPNILLIIIYYAIIVSLRFSILKKDTIKKHYKKIIEVLLIIILIFNLIEILPSDLKIYFIDVGQGDSTLIVTPKNKKILIDSGGSKLKESFDVGESTLVPYLLNRGINKLDYIIISHFDADHCNGFIAVLDKIKVGKVIISKQAEICSEYETIINIIKEKNIPVQIVKKGDKIQFDKYVYIDILYPTKNLKFNDINNNSIVCKLIYGKFSMLFTGDVEKEAEDEILSLYKNTNILNVTILKAGHHGSKTSSTEKFLEAVKPKIVLIGVGENNTFGHPSEQVIKNLEKCGAQIFRTDLNGEIIIKVNKKGKILINKMLN